MKFTGTATAMATSAANSFGMPAHSARASTACCVR